MTSTLAGATVTHAHVTIPAHGTWWADVRVDGETDLTGSVVLQLEDLTLTGTVVSGGADKGRGSYRVAGGAGGWGTELAALSYANDAGVKVATILQDAATSAGETLAATTLPTTKVGPQYVREAGPASLVLQKLAAEGWYVGEDGETRIGRRAAVAVDIPSGVGEIDRSARRVTVAAGTIAKLLPGATFEGFEVSDVLHVVTPEGGVRTTLYGKGAEDGSRRLVALRGLLEQLLPDYRYRGVYEYRVVSQAGERLNLQAILASSGMPDLRRVTVRPGVAGARADVALGSRVLVAFVNADPARPFVCGFEDADGAGFVPTRLDLDADTTLTLAGGTLGVARQTDPVVAGPFAGTITVGSSKVKAG